MVFDVGSVLVEAGRTLADDIALAGFSVDPAWVVEFESRLAQLPRPNVGAVDAATYAGLFADASVGRFNACDATRIARSGLAAEYPGIVTLFDALDAVPIDSALLSNVHEAEWLHLLPIDLRGTAFPTLLRARYRFASHLIGATKPDPRIYAALEDGTGRQPEKILFFDDREENVVAAQDRGWTAELIDYRHDTVAQLFTGLRDHGVLS
ncbi:MAG: HAD-IA family hydrolase [Chloroflexi bacterium]|nr:HAD-IA family hydrolase [Chloroflexota bacterium]